MRFAVYAVPKPESPLYKAASAVIGYNVVTGKRAQFADHPAFQDPRWEALSEAPRRYGFHATLKAPFELAEGVSEHDLLVAVAALARSLSAVETGPLVLSDRNAFFALRPMTPDHGGLRALAQACVEGLDHLRAPLSPADMARRLAAVLTERQRVSLERFGYPYTGPDFHFHMTLSEQVPADQRARVRTGLEAVLPPLPIFLLIDDIVVCRQFERSGAFKLLARFALGARDG